jgi:four helix bundle protein
MSAARGPNLAVARVVVARRYEDLLVWQLADELRSYVHRSTDSAAFRQQQWLQGQLRRAAQSACANVAEGFGRYKPKDFARFVRAARGSFEETKAHLDEVRLLGLADEAEVSEIRSLANRACAAATKLIRYLESAKEP